MNQELCATVMPEGLVRLEWIETKERIGKSSLLLQKEIYTRFIEDQDSWFLFLGFCSKKVRLSPSLGYFRDLAGLFVKKLSHTPDLEIIRHKIGILLDEEERTHILETIPMITGSEYISQELINEIWNNLNQTFSKAIKIYQGSVEEFIKSYTPDVHLVGRVFFHLVENKNQDVPFAFLATYSTRLNQDGKSKHLPLKYALKEYSENHDQLLELLSTVHQAAQKSDFISELVETGELFQPLALSAKEAFLFLKEIPIYEESGVLCRIPNWWKKGTSSIKLDLNIGGKQPAFVGMDAILDFKARLLLGDTEITVEEAKKILEESEGLAFIKNKWVAVDPEKLKKTLDAYEKARKMAGMGFQLKDALLLQLNPDKIVDSQDEDIETTVSHGKWIESVIKKLVNPELISNIKPHKNFKANLRKYQQKGLNWLYFLHKLQFGACLADDMGLGKTIQILAFLSVIKAKKASLLVVPASLISNWASEINKFFPKLRFFIAHPSAHKKNSIDTKSQTAIDQLDLIITTYALIQKYKWITDYSFEYVILDEAQAIKNPGTKQSKAAKKLNSKNRIIMTGTPVENRISDLWSLFDFLNPGLLGSKTEFGKFSKELKNNPDGYSRLRKIIAPYLLRRLKTDKNVISDLPDKVEMKSYAPLSKKQIILYNNLVNEIKESIEQLDGIQRKGLILGSLIKLKQLCNHPDQFLGNTEYDEKESGKFIRLREICETIYAKRERVLIFTQFKEMTQPINDYLESIFKRKGLILHGSVTVGKRKKIIEQFQGDEYTPFMVLSLKAGGVGLNLTQANHVIHFDRWWNPAVENQATDRSFRIGQTKKVIVHKFLTQSTIEEKIDKMLEEKSKMSNEIITNSGESWITEMDNDELMELFKLTL